MMLRRVLVGIAVLALLVAGGIALMTRQKTGVLVESARVIATNSVPGDALVYMDLRNTGTQTDILIGVTSEDAGDCGFHGPTVSEGADGLPFVTVPPGAKTSLSADTAHLELLGFDKIVKVGDLVPLTLHFQNAGDVPIKARVEALVASTDLVRQAGLYEPGPGEPVPDIALKAEPLGDGRWRLTVTGDNFTFDKGSVDQPHQPGHGHGHLYIDNVKIGRLYGPVFETDPLPPGPHQFAVTLNTNDHRAYAKNGEPITATTTVN